MSVLSADGGVRAAARGIQAPLGRLSFRGGSTQLRPSPAGGRLGIAPAHPFLRAELVAHARATACPAAADRHRRLQRAGLGLRLAVARSGETLLPAAVAWRVALYTPPVVAAVVPPAGPAAPARSPWAARAAASPQRLCHTPGSKAFRRHSPVW